MEIGQDLSLHEVTFSNGISMILKEYHESIKKKGQSCFNIFSLNCTKEWSFYFHFEGCNKHTKNPSQFV